MKSQQCIRWDETPFGKGRSESETSLWRRAESQAGRESSAETVEGEEAGEESGCKWGCQEGISGGDGAVRGRGAEAARGVRGRGEVAMGQPGRARARRGRCGRAAAATSRRMIILWSPHKSKVMCVC